MFAKKNKHIIQKENVDLEHGGKVDVVQNTFQSLLDCVQNVDVELEDEILPSIYMAPSNLRDLSQSSFNPRVVSSGPLHREDKNVKAFEGRKASYIHKLLKRVKNIPREQTLEACVQKVAAKIKQIKRCYAGIEASNDTEFVKMMVMDACFILEFIKGYAEPKEKTQLNLREQSIMYDLVLLENQIPFFVLDDIFLCTIKKSDPDTSLIELIHPVLKFLNIFGASIKIKYICIDTTPKHILGILHQCYQPRSTKISYFSSSTIHSAVELDRAGVNFKPIRDKRWSMAMEVTLHLHRFLRFPWSLRKPTIRMPVLRLHHFTELVLRNMIAYEQSSLGDTSYVTSYAIAMDRLIDTQEDVAVLVKSKVLVNNMGSNEEAANMMNNICKEVAWVHIGPTKHGKRLDTYCNDYWPKSIAKLRRTYFSSPWSIIALIAGIVLFALTVIQTIFTIKPLGNKN